METCRPLTSLAVKRAKLQATILLPLETRKVARGDTVILSPKLRHQSSVAPYSTDNRCTNRLIIAGICSDPSSWQSPRLISFKFALFQVEGGFVQGLGLFTLEELRYSQSGSPWTTGPGAYKIPGFADIPVEFYVHLLRSAPNEKAVYSSKV